MICAAMVASVYARLGGRGYAKDCAIGAAAVLSSPIRAICTTNSDPFGLASTNRRALVDASSVITLGLACVDAEAANRPLHRL